MAAPPGHPLATSCSAGSVDHAGAWSWQRTVDVPLNEQFERSEVGIGDPDLPGTSWETPQMSFTLDAATHAQLQTDFAGAALWVRQVGSYARSEPLILTTIS